MTLKRKIKQAMLVILSEREQTQNEARRKELEKEFWTLRNLLR